MADNTVTGAVTSSIRPQARPKAVSGIGAKAPARQEEKAELSFMDKIANLFTSFGGKDPKEKPASVNTYNAKISVYQDMEDEARRSAELARQDRQGLGITRSLTGQEWAQKFGKEKAIEPNVTSPFWHQGQEHPEVLTPAPVEAAAIPVPVEAAAIPAQTTGEGLMARSGNIRNEPPEPTVNSEVFLSGLQSILGNDGNFSKDSLTEALTSTIRNPTKQALIKGMAQIEVGDTGPRTERGYSLANVKAIKPTSDWGQRLVRDGIMNPDGTVNVDKYSADNVFNSVYGDRADLGNGDFASGDGSRFKGRGLLQLTGRRTYQEVQNRLRNQGINIDIMSNPDLVNDSRYALPAAIAYLEYKGLSDKDSENMTAKGLNNLINSGASATVAKERWDAVVQALRDSDMEDKANELELRNEYSAQETAGLTGGQVDGAIGPTSRAAMRGWLTSNNITIPENITDADLVVLVNKNAP